MPICHSSLIQLGERLVRRWYLDEQLIKLITRVRPDVVRVAICSFNGAPPRKRGKEIGALNLNCIQSELLRQGVAPQFLPPSFRDFFSAIQQVMRSELPAVCADFVAGKLPARSMLPASIGRVTGDPVALAVRGMSNFTELPNGSGAEEDLAGVYDPVRSNKKRERQQEPDWMRELRRAFAGAY